MSAPQPLQQRILGVLEAQGSIPAKDMGHWLKDVDAIALDCALNALLRASKITRELGRYDLVRVAPRARDQRGESKPVSNQEAVPTAAEEAAASLRPATRECQSCKVPQAICEFRFIGSGGLRAKECNTCHGKRARAGQAKRRGERATVLVNGGSGESIERHLDGSDKYQSPLPDGAKPSPTSSAIECGAPRPEAGDRAGPQVSGHNLEAGRVNAPLETTSKTVESPAPDSLHDRVTLQRQAGLNKIALLEVELANARAYVEERERFLEMYERFSEGDR